MPIFYSKTGAPVNVADESYSANKSYWDAFVSSGELSATAPSVAPVPVVPAVVPTTQPVVQPSAPVVQPGIGTTQAYTPPQATNANNAYYRDAQGNVHRASDNAHVTAGNADPALDWNKLGLNVGHLNTLDQIKAQSGAVASSDQARAAELAAEQKKKEAEAKALADEQSKIGSLQNQKTIADLKTSLGITDTTKPALPNFTDTYTALRTSYGISDIESQLTSLDKQIADVTASMKMGLRDEEGQLRPMELIGSRQQEIQRQANDQLDSLNASRSALVSEYNTKSNVISTMMNLSQADYTAASDAYNTQFSQAVQVQQLFNQEEEQAQDLATTTANTARANLQIVMNSLSESSTSWNDIDESMRSQITSLELKSGIPQGTVSALLQSSPNMKIAYTNVVENEDDSETVSFFGQDKSTGAVKLINAITSGGGTGGGMGGGTGGIIPSDGFVSSKIESSVRSEADDMLADGTSSEETYTRLRRRYSTQEASDTALQKLTGYTPSQPGATESGGNWSWLNPLNWF